MTMRIPFGKLNHDRRLTVTDWWDMIEQSCPLLDDQQKNRLSDVLSGREQVHNFVYKDLRKILRWRQHGDPRKSCIVLDPWCDKLESVAVNQLTRMVQYLMYCRITKTEFDIELAWFTP
ncbi:uncharacterized protein LOC129597867 [Paramacrobiotus metropolitanus]|uniref:uncharacterized protein LOC129597867 n=1 Tax=Paramacrobiotus metropolitanus TaxID=2943436 RepID=UPI00244636B7|nr:uncharacterized protein LOC129597867 [Paramacrobiotus metropolitanus]